MMFRYGLVWSMEKSGMLEFKVGKVVIGKKAVREKDLALERTKMCSAVFKTVIG